MRLVRGVVGLFALGLGIGFGATGSLLAIPNSFSNGAVADAVAVNDNFDNLDGRVQGLQDNNNVGGLAGTDLVVVSARIDAGGGVSEENGDWINGSCSNTVTGQYGCTIHSTVFTGTPHCWGSLLTTNGGYVSISSSPLPSATFVKFLAWDDNAAPAGHAGYYFCMGQRP